MRQLYTQLANEIAYEMDKNILKMAADQAKESLFKQIVDAANGNLPKGQPFFEESINWYTTDPYYTKELEETLEEIGKGNFDGKFYKNPKAIIDTIKSWGYNVSPGKNMSEVEFYESDKLNANKNGDRIGAGNAATEDVPYAIAEYSKGNSGPLSKLTKEQISNYFYSPEHTQEAVAALLTLVGKA